MRLKVDSKALLKKLVERKMSVWEASQQLKMDYGNFSRYLKKDKAIRPKTAFLATRWCMWQVIR